MFEKELINALLDGQPYFGPAMRALQGPPVRHRYLGAIVEFVANSRRRGRIRILEVGSWAGASAVTWAKALQGLKRKGHVTCVDLWEPYFNENIDFEEHYRGMTEAAQGRKIFRLFLHNIKATNVCNMVEYIVGSGRVVLPKLPNAKYDIVYIDGSHEYESVRADIQDAKRIVRNHGIICGDDLELQKHELDSAEHEAALQSAKDYVYSEAARGSYHPGVTEAVAREFEAVSVWDGVWAVEKVDQEWAKIEIDANKTHVPEHIAKAVSAAQITEVGQTRDFKLMVIGGRYAAVAKSVGTVGLFEERLGERELPPLLLTAASFEEVQRKAIKIEEKIQPPIELVGETPEFNLVRSKGRFLAAAKSMGPTALLVERLGQRDLPPLVFVGDSCDEVSEKAKSIEKLPRHVQLIEELGNYNIVKAGDVFVAIAKMLGPVGLFVERLGERDLPPYILLGTDLSTMRQRASEASVVLNIEANNL